MACKFSKIPPMPATCVQVTLVTSAPRLLERMTAAASDYCTAWLEARDVQVLCGERIAGKASGWVRG